MNANELADALDDVVANYIQMIADVDFSDVATMLRQQQAEIEALKQIIDANNLNQNIGQFVKPTNEPVAWTDGKGNYFDKNSFFPVDDLIPLYTHPVKELTDEEIEIEWFKVFKPETGIGKNLTNGVYEFARAILKKASEK